MKIVNVKGYEGLYCVTDEGVIFSLKSGLEIKPALRFDGYCQVTLNRNGEKHTVNLHCVVYSSFHTRKKELVIDHIDGDKTNNRLSNLRQITTRENTARAKTNKYARGVKYISHLDKYGAEIGIDGERFYLGAFETPDTAHEAYLKAKSDWEKDGIKPEKADRSTKLCKTCGRTLPIDDFYYIKNHGRSWMCKQCSREYSKRKRDEKRDSSE